MKKILFKVLNSFGLQVSRTKCSTNITYQFVQKIMDKKIEIVFDVGANVGQTGIALRSHGYKGKIISFEPSSSAFKKLLSLSGKDKNWICYERCAIGAEDIVTTINISRNSVSSSILKINETHTIAAKNSIAISEEEVKVVPLSKVIVELGLQNKKIAIKMDTQGYEMHVLEGLENYLKNVVVLQTELSLVELYEGQILAKETTNYLENHGFELVGLHAGFCNEESSNMLQYDALFEKN